MSTLVSIETREYLNRNRKRERKSRLNKNEHHSPRIEPLTLNRLESDHSHRWSKLVSIEQSRMHVRFQWELLTSRLFKALAIFFWFFRISRWIFSRRDWRCWMSLSCCRCWEIWFSTCFNKVDCWPSSIWTSSWLVELTGSSAVNRSRLAVECFGLLGCLAFFLLIEMVTTFLGKGLFLVWVRSSWSSLESMLSTSSFSESSVISKRDVDRFNLSGEGKLTVKRFYWRRDTTSFSWCDKW